MTETSQYRTDLPQLSGASFLTDGGLETYLVFHEDYDLPCFAAFVLLGDGSGVETLKRYFRRYMALARDHGVGFVFESPTWRANPDWAEKIGYGPEALDRANRAAIDLMAALRAEAAGEMAQPMPISGCVGPRGDGYVAGEAMTAEEAAAYHARQIATFADTAADLVTAITMTNAPEAAGVALAARAAGIPSAISFTVETDGRLPTGQPLGEAIDEVDARTGTAPAYYMINCAHPDHFRDVLVAEAPRFRRIKGLRANSSRMSHAELDAASALDEGDPAELGHQYGELRATVGGFSVLGGCCGTDHRHIAAIAEACLPVARAA